MGDSQNSCDGELPIEVPADEVEEEQNGDYECSQQPSSSGISQFSESCDEPASENLRHILEQVQNTMRQLTTKLPVDVKSEPGSPTPSAEETSDLAAGQILGPFSIANPNVSDANTVPLTLLNDNGQPYSVRVFGSDLDRVLTRIRCTTSVNEANSIFYLHEGNLWVLTMSAIRRDDNIVAILPSGRTSPPTNQKRFACEGCRSASFKSLENLLAHRKLFCKGKAEVLGRDRAHSDSASPQDLPVHFPSLLSLQGSVNTNNVMRAPPASFPSLPLSLPNVLFLPLAYHDLPQPGFVQLLGPAQTVIPVAISRGTVPPPATNSPTTTPFGPSHILVNANHNTPESLSITCGEIQLQIPVVKLPFDSQSSTSTTHSGAVKRSAATSSNSSPLDLSKRQRTLSTPLLTVQTSSIVPLPISISTSKKIDVEKPFMCNCGVSFSAEATLSAHQLHYCRHSVRSLSESQIARDVPRKIPSRCSQCDFEPHSASQLSVHMRSAHADIQAYVCRECGYRGYSQRGIRAHLRSHTHLDNIKFETLLNTHVEKVRHFRSSSGSENGMVRSPTNAVEAEH